MYFKIIFLFFVLDLTLFPQEPALYKNSALPLKERVKDLVSKMSLEEKISQMTYNSSAIERLGIPAYNWWNEGLHGFARSGIATVFPQAIGLAATWDTALIFRTACIISDEARAKYNKALMKSKTGIYEGITIWSPNINIFRDPRWGRGMETYGEDPYLTGEMGVNFVRGLQGNDPEYLKTIATPKHFAVHSGPESLRHIFNAEVSDYDLRETYLPHFRKCLVEGKAYSVMCAYNRLRGQACCGSDTLLGNILRKEWGFKGYVVSDCWAVSDISEYHKIVNSTEEAAALAVKSGTDLECGNSYPLLLDAVKKGMISEDQIDTSLVRIYTARFKLGMFDPPEKVPYSHISVFDTDEAKAASLEAARESIVLLKNDNLLPLKKDLKRIAVLGPNSDDVEVLLGNYNGFPSHPVTPLQGIRDKVKNCEVIYERGCDIAEGIPALVQIDSAVFFTSEKKNERGLTGSYYNNYEFKGTPLFSRIDKDINFHWWDQAPDIKLDPVNFGVKWTGVLVPRVSGEYALGGYGFSGYKIYLEDSLLAEFEGEHEPVKRFKHVSLTAGRCYRIRIEFHNNARYSFMQLIWSVPSSDNLTKAVQAAKEADVTIMFMGLSPRLEGEEMDVEVKGFKGGDRLSLDLPETQSVLIEKIYELKKPVILVLLNGSALSVNWEEKNLPAIIEAWYPGQAGGTAIADVLFGNYNPAGRLPVTFYKSVEQLPDFSDYNMSNRTYRYFKGEPLYNFGYGLSYTSFSYSNLKLQNENIRVGEVTSLYFDLTNTGKMKGEEVVQLYVKASDDNRIIKSLKGFKRITLEPGETRRIEFNISPAQLTRWIGDEGYSLTSGEYQLMIGSSSADKDLSSIKLTVE